jgi:LysR family transcriptional regulator, regulator for bpeEF and oprC
VQFDHLDGVVMFVRAGTAGSFAAAARAAGVTPSAVSKAVSRLEAHLRVRLFDRTTHAIRLTPDGRAYYERCRAALETIGQAEDLLLGRADAAPSGRLRVSASTPFARIALAPILPAFVAAFPDVSVELVATDRMSELVEDGFDVAIRTGELDDSGLVVRKLIDSRMVAAAAPAYLVQRGAPKHPRELSRHERLAFIFPQTGRTFPWHFMVDGKDVQVAPAERLAFNDAGAMIAAAEAGGGVVFLQDYILAKSMTEGRLVEVLCDFSADGGPVSAVWLPTKQLSPKIRAFVDTLASGLGSYRA